MTLSRKRIPYYKSKLKSNPNDAESQFKLGYIYDASGEQTEALKYYEDALNSDPEFWQANINLGFISASNHNFEAAIEQWEKAFLADIKINTLLQDIEYANFYSLKIKEVEQILQKQILLEPKHADFYYQLGVFQLYFKKPEMALSSFVKAQELNPNLTKSYLFCGEIYAKLSQNSHAILQLQKALSLNPKLYKAYYCLGKIYGKESNFNLAQIQFEKAIENNASFCEAHRALGKIYFRQGKLDQAIKQYQKSIDLNNLNWEGHFELAKACDKIYQIDFAIKEYEKTISLNPNSEEAYYNLAIDYKQTGEIKKAINTFNNLLKIDPSNHSANYQLGTIYLHQEKYKTAVKYLEKALEKNPNDVYTLYNLGILYYNLSSFREAAEQINKAISLNPNEAEYYNMLGKIYKKLNKNMEAISAFEKYLKINPANYELTSDIGILHLKLKNYPHALQIFEKLINISPDISSYYLSAVSNYYLNNYDQTTSNLTLALQADSNVSAIQHFMGCIEMLYNNDTEKGAEHFKKSLKLNPVFLNALFDLSRMLIKNKKIKEANDLLSKAYDQDDLTPENFLALAVLYAESREFNKAFQMIEKTMSIDKENYLVFSVWGYIYTLKKEASNAINCYEKAHSLNNSFTYAQSAINKLKSQEYEIEPPYFINELFLVPYIGDLKKEPVKVIQKEIIAEEKEVEEVKIQKEVFVEQSISDIPQNTEQIFDAYFKNIEKPISKASQTVLKLADAYLELKKFDMALPELEKLINSDVKNKDILTKYALCKSKLKQYKEAANILEEVFNKYKEKDILISLINNISKINDAEKLKHYCEKSLADFALTVNERKKMKKLLSKLEDEE